MERVAGIEPACAAWKAAVLPLNYTRARHVLAILSHLLALLVCCALTRSHCLAAHPVLFFSSKRRRHSTRNFSSAAPLAIVAERNEMLCATQSCKARRNFARASTIAQLIRAPLGVRTFSGWKPLGIYVFKIQHFLDIFDNSSKCLCLICLRVSEMIR